MPRWGCPQPSGAPACFPLFLPQTATLHTHPARTRLARPPDSQTQSFLGPLLSALARLRLSPETPANPTRQKFPASRPGASLQRLMLDLKTHPHLASPSISTPFVWINFLWKLFFPLEKNFEKLTGQDDVPPCLQLGDLQHPMTLHLCLPLEGVSPLQERSQRLPQPGQPPQRGGGWGPLPANAAINNSPSRCLGIPKGLS